MRRALKHTPTRVREYALLGYEAAYASKPLTFAPEQHHKATQLVVKQANNTREYCIIRLLLLLEC